MKKVILSILKFIGAAVLQLVIYAFVIVMWCLVLGVCALSIYYAKDYKPLPDLIGNILFIVSIIALFFLTLLLIIGGLIGESVFHDEAEYFSFKKATIFCNIAF